MWLLFQFFSYKNNWVLEWWLLIFKFCDCLYSIDKQLLTRVFQLSRNAFYAFYKITIYNFCHSMKIFERILDARLRRIAAITPNQCGFVKGSGTSDAISVDRWKKYKTVGCAKNSLKTVKNPSHDFLKSSQKPSLKLPKFHLKTVKYLFVILLEWPEEKFITINILFSKIKEMKNILKPIIDQL